MSNKNSSKQHYRTSINLSVKRDNGVYAALPEEFEELANFAIKYYETAPDFFGELDVGKMATRLAHALTRAPAFVYIKNGEIVGAIVLDVICPWWSNEPYLTDLFIYVEKEHRSFKIIKRLLESCKDYAIINNDLRMEFTVFNPDDLGRKEKLFNRLGFKTEAIMFTRNKE